MKKGMLMMAAMAMAAFSMTGCGDNQGTGNAGDTAQGTAGDTYKIGGIGPLTGNAASYGTSVKQGAQVAVDEINAAGGVNGKNLELVFEDDQCNEEKAVSAYNKLMDENITALIGAVTSGCSIAVGDESVNDGILQITPSGSAQDCTKNDNEFRICFTDPVQGEKMAQYIKDQGKQNVAMIYDAADEYSKGIADAFTAKAEELGLNIVASESFNSGDVDFKSQLTKIKGTNADCLFLPIYYAEVGFISEQAKTVGVELPYYGCDGWDGVIAQLKGDTTNINGAVFLTPFVATDDAENVKAFVEAYNTAFGADPDQFAADGYDAVFAVKAAIEKAGDDVTNENLIAAMPEITVNGVTGDMTFTPEGEPNKDAKFAVIQDGKYVAEQ